MTERGALRILAAIFGSTASSRVQHGEEQHYHERVQLSSMKMTSKISHLMLRLEACIQPPSLLLLLPLGVKATGYCYMNLVLVLEDDRNILLERGMKV